MGEGKGEGTMDRVLQERLLARAREKGALKFGEYVLASGARSSYYFDGRLLSLDAEGAYLLGKLLLPLVQEADAQAIGGPTLGADPIVGATIAMSYLEGTPITGFLVRPERKEHGTGQQVEGPLEPGSRVVVVDDACTTGGSLFRAVEAAESSNCQVVLVVAVLDRKEGGSDEVRRRGYAFRCLLEATPEGGVRLAQ